MKIICSVGDRKPFVALWFLWCEDLTCDWLQHNKHSRHILGVHGNIISAVINYKGVKILSMAGTPGENFVANAWISCHLHNYFYLHHALDKYFHVEALYDYSYEKIKSRKKPWVKKTKKAGSRKNERDKKHVAMRCFSQEIMIYCQGH